jgi:hypothetical protein
LLRRARSMKDAVASRPDIRKTYSCRARMRRSFMWFG